MIRRYLASANTGKQFICNFDQINKSAKDGFLYIIKGGSGTGKSTIMKSVAKYFLEKNLDIEYFYCSSDINSLDGIRIKKLNISIIDGTAPHTMDTKLLGVSDRLVDVGCFVRRAVKDNKVDILKYQNKKSFYFRLVNNYLTSANKLLNNNIEILKTEQKPNKQKQYVDYLVDLLRLDKQFGKGYKREFFINSLDGSLVEKNDFEKIVDVEFDILTNTNILERLTKVLDKYNYKYIVFKNIVEPNMIDGIEIESVGFVQSKINNRLENKQMTKLLAENDNHISKLVKLAKNCLIIARKNHLKIEANYIKNMDFKKVDEVIEKLIGEINE